MFEIWSMMSKGLSNKQKMIMVANSLRKDDYYIVSKIEEGQQKIITCVKCKKETDLSESVEYGEAVKMFAVRNGMCMACHRELEQVVNRLLNSPKPQEIKNA